MEMRLGSDILRDIFFNSPFAYLDEVKPARRTDTGIFLYNIMYIKYFFIFYIRYILICIYIYKYLLYVIRKDEEVRGGLYFTMQIGRISKRILTVIDEFVLQGPMWVKDREVSLAKSNYVRTLVNHTCVNGNY